VCRRLSTWCCTPPGLPNFHTALSSGSSTASRRTHPDRPRRMKEVNPDMYSPASGTPASDAAPREPDMSTIAGSLGQRSASACRCSADRPSPARRREEAMAPRSGSRARLRSAGWSHDSPGSLGRRGERPPPPRSSRQRGRGKTSPVLSGRSARTAVESGISKLTAMSCAILPHGPPFGV